MPAPGYIGTGLDAASTQVPMFLSPIPLSFVLTTSSHHTSPLTAGRF
jgi:hypothetical protein